MCLVCDVCVCSLGGMSVRVRGLSICACAVCAIYVCGVGVMCVMCGVEWGLCLSP